MSRHRNIRSMNVQEECERDDDIYGHSYEDHDYGTSPGTASMYMYDRSKAYQQTSYFASPMSSVNTEMIEEEDYDDMDNHQEVLDDSASPTSLARQKLGLEDTVKLNSCLEEMQNILGDSVPESVMIKAAIECKFDLEHALDQLLNKSAPVEQPKPQRQQRDRGNRSFAHDGSASKVEVNGRFPKSDSTDISSGVSQLKFVIGGTEGDSVTASTSSAHPTTVASSSSKTKYARGDVSEFADIGGATPVKAAKPEAAETPTTSVPSTPSQIPRSASRARFDRLDVQKEYEKRKAGGKDHINLVVIGHVDAGKSTLMGHMLYQLGFVTKKAMHKFEQDSRKAGKGSFAYAWVLDETEEERSRGVTMDIAQTYFETPSKVVTLLDAPGHKDFIPNMITGAAQADVAVLVVNATKGEFETGFDAGGQTREHTMLVRSLGVSQLVVAVNKMDTVDWSKERYDDVVQKLGAFMRQAAGFKDSDLSFIPCSGLVGDNLASSPPAGHPLLTWYSGPTLLDQIDRFKPPVRPVLDKPLRLCVTDVFKAGSGLAVAGTLQAGSVQANDRVLVMPANQAAVVKAITVDENQVSIGFAGDNVVVTLTGIDSTNISIVSAGSIVCDLLSPVLPSARFQARIVVFNINFPITKGFPVVLHYQSLTEQAYIRRLISQLARNTGEVIKKKPRCLVKNSSAVVEIEVDRPVCLELYSNFKDLGRFMLRSSGTSIAAGVVTEILGSRQQQEPGT